MPPQNAPQSSDAGTPKSLDRLRAAIRLRHFSRRTEEAYVGWVRRYILFHRKRHPAEMTEADVTAFLTHLARGRGVSASTQNQALCALLFMYRHVLGRELGALDGLVWAKRSSHVPVVLTRDEVMSVLGQLSGPSWLIVALLYGAGLRLTECLELRVKDVDMTGRQIVVRSGKGQKDRRTMLPSSILELLERHLRVVQRLHARDARAGFGRVSLPDALAMKYPQAATEWRWQFVFPAMQPVLRPTGSLLRSRRPSLEKNSIVRGYVAWLQRNLRFSNKCGTISHAVCMISRRLSRREGSSLDHPAPKKLLPRRPRRSKGR